MITTLPERAAALPGEAGAAFERLFFVERTRGHAVIPPEMEPWVRASFGSADAVRQQTVVRVVNRLTLESALLNPLRARRPAGGAGSDAELEDWIARELAEQDAFADPLRRTPADPFGRIEGRFCVSASNVAKYEGWHGLVLFRDPHPLRVGPEQLEDYLHVALRWAAAAHASDPGARFPMVTWNCLPKSGATIVHGHMQVAVARGMHYARPECWRAAAERYRAAAGRGFFDDMALVHQALGLAVRDEPGLRAFAHLTPLRNREVLLMAEPAEPAALAARLAAALSPLLRALIGSHGVRALNLGLALPPLAQHSGWEEFPVLVRLVDRGAALTTRNDWGAMELFGSGCVTADPFEVAEQLRGAGA